MLYVTLRVIFRGLFKFLFFYRVEGMEHIPQTGPVILCANHISLFDPPFVATPLKRRARFMAKEELFRIPGFNKIIQNLGAFPVKRGGVSKETIRATLNILKSGELLCIFPEGSRSNAGGLGKKGAASFALKSGATVIPAAIIGNYRPFRRMRIIYGKPVDLSPYSERVDSASLEQATEAIMSSIRQLLRNSV